MARAVELWRCECGTRLKIITEIDSTTSTRQTVSCPRCRNTKTINAERIITVTEDKDISFRSSALISCEEKEGLLAARNLASDNYRREASELAAVTGRMIARSEFKFLAER